MRKTAKIFLLLIAFFCLIYPACLFFCNRYLIPKLFQQLPFTEHSFQIDSLTPWKLAGQLHLADQNNKIVLSRLEIHYSLISLLQGELKQIIFNGIIIHLLLEDGQILFPTFIQQESHTKERLPSNFFISPKKILLQNCGIFIEDRESSFQTTLFVNGKLSITPSSDLAKATSIKGAFVLKGDIPANCTFSGKFSKQASTLQAQLHLPKFERLKTILPPPFTLSGEGNIDASISLDSTYSLQKYGLVLQSTTARLIYDNIELRSSQQNPLQATVDGNKANAHFTLHNLHLNAPEQITGNIKGKFVLGDSLEGNVILHTPYSTSPLNLNFQTKKGDDGENRIAAELTGKDLHYKDILLPSVTVQTTAQLKDGTATGEIQLNFPQLLLPRVRFIKGKISFPFKFPAQETKPGEIFISSIKYNDTDIGRIRAKVQQTVTGLTTELRMTTPLLENFHLTCKSNLQQSPFIINTNCNLPPATFDSDKLFAKLKQNLPAELHFSGKMNAKSSLTFAENKLAGSTHLAITEGSLTQGETTLTGIQTSVTIPNIPHLQSAPHQRLTIEHITSGDIQASMADISWRMEKPDIIFIENAQLNWCGGRIGTASLTLSPAQKGLKTTFYCDRLRLSELLSQFGVAEASGEVSLNGRLPILLESKKLTINNGFLFSTPGEKGVLNFTNIKTITDSIPAFNTTPHITYSFESLRNFSYNWVKIFFNTEKEDLIIQMQLDGKPTKPLPYAYKNGKIVSSNTGPGLQHPVHLDVNFRLPLQQMFEYETAAQSLIKKFMENF